MRKAATRAPAALSVGSDFEVLDEGLGVRREQRVVAEELGGNQRVVPPQALEPLPLGVLEHHEHEVGGEVVDAHLADRVEHLVERERRGDGLAHLVEREGLAEAEVLRREAPLLEAALDDVHHLLDAEGLEHVVVGAALHRVDGRLDGAEARHDHRHHVGVVLVDVLEQLDAPHVGHLQVGDHQVVGVRVDLGERDAPVFGRADLKAFEREKVREDLADDLLVVDHEDARRLLWCA